MGKTVVFFSALSIWSLGNKIGAPSFYQTIVGYVRNGWRVILITPHCSEEKDFPDVKLIHFKSRSVHNHVYKPLKLFDNILYSNSLKRGMYKKGKEILESLIEEKAVLIYAYEVHAVKACAALAEEYSRPLITRFQGTILSAKGKSLLIQLGYYPHYQALKQKADLVIMTDDGTQGKAYLENIGNKSKVLFLRNGLDLDENIAGAINITEIRHQLGISDKDKVLMTISRLVGWKRVDRAIVCLAETLKKMSNVKLVIIGDGQEKGALQELARSMEVFEQVLFVGAVKHNYIKQYLQVADVFLSLYDLSNLGNPLFEAMKCGRAVVTLNNGDTKSVITNGENGMLIEPEDERGLSDAVTLLLSEEKMRNRLGENAYEYAKKFFLSWDERMRFECQEVEKLIGNINID